MLRALPTDLPVHRSAFKGNRIGFKRNTDLCTAATSLRTIWLVSQSRSETDPSQAALRSAGLSRFSVGQPGSSARKRQSLESFPWTDRVSSAPTPSRVRTQQVLHNVEQTTVQEARYQRI
jgi:hypothetical protein